MTETARQHGLHSFHGGLHLEGHKSISAGTPVGHVPLAAELVLPLQQHIGAQPDVVVSVGDHVLKGQELAHFADGISASIHAPTSGTIRAIEKRPVPHPSGLNATCIVLATDGKDEWITREPIGDDYRNRDCRDILSVIEAAGIVGLGGATFPTAAKLQSCDQRKIETLIINGAECEPYISCDDALMQQQAAEVVRGSEILRHLLGVSLCQIAIEDNKPAAISAMQQAVKDTGYDKVSIITIPTLYPTGGEKQLIKVLTGLEVPSKGLPADIGVLCQNVATAHSIYRAVYHAEPLLSRIVTVTGDAVENPGNYNVLLGTPMADVIKQAGGYKNTIGGLIMGGPMMGFSLPDDELPVTKACNCLLTLTAEESARPPVSPCIRCGECVKVCPADLLPQQLYWYASSKNFDRAQDLNLFDCIECGCCSYVCPSHIPLVQYYRFAKAEIWAQEKDRIKSDRARERHEFREARLAREKAEREEKLRQKKEMLAKKKAAEGKQADAPDPKKAAIEAALARVKAKKEAAAEEPRNTDNLTAAQQKQIDDADARRKESAQASSPPAEAKDKE